MKWIMTGTPSALDIERITFLANIAIIRKKRAGPFRTREEKQEARARFEAEFKAADKDGDGGLSRAELAESRALPGSSRHFGVMDANFDAMDANGDGKVTLAERDAWLRARAAEKKS
jgi:Ca2+-binding EF-hand superfamily protein